VAGVTQVRLDTTYARVAVHQTQSTVHIEHTRENFTSLPLSQARLRSTGPYIMVDGTEMREALGLLNVTARRQANGDDARQALRDGIAGMVAEGHMLGDIEDGFRVADVAERAHGPGPAVNVALRALPPPAVEIIPKTVSVEFDTVGGVSPLYRAVPHLAWSPAEFDVSLDPPGDVRMALAPPGFAVGREIDAFA
jgi:hypothetical protein